MPPRSFVALDLETTGLNPDRDAIIEVGAVKYRDGEAVEEFSTFVNPGRPIPYEIRLLTGICDQDVMRAPVISAVAGPLGRFAGLLPIVGHNIGFDLAFLRAQGLLVENQGLDTWELASILLPGQGSYSLAALGRRFSIPHAVKHRALSDALATAHLFLHLCDAAAGLPHYTLTELVRLIRHSNWPLAPVFADAARTAFAGDPLAGHVSGREAAWTELLGPDNPLHHPLQQSEPLVPSEASQQVDTEELAAFLRPDGLFARTFSGYEFRPPQVEMLGAVAGAFNNQHHLLAEAGTGTGKSVAYLLPAIAFAVRNQTRVVVSTNTINLQDQLFKKDLPDLQRILGQAWGKAQPFRAALLKGRNNYLCIRRFNALRSRPNLDAFELRGIARILVWLPQTRTGDQAELSLPLARDRQIWSQVAADGDGCSLERCQRETGGRCFFYRARKAAESAHVLVVNHALLMADAAAENRVLPEYHYLVVDEAHHLEDAATEQLSFKADAHTVKQLLSALHPPDGGRAGGLLADLAVILKRVPDDVAALVRDQLVRSQVEVETVGARLSNFWEVIDEIVATAHPQAANGDYDARLRITEHVRNEPLWVEVEVSWENLSVTWQAMRKRLLSLLGALGDMAQGGYAPQGLESLGEELGSVLRDLDKLYADMEAWAVKPDRNGIYWIESNAGNGTVTLRSAPLNVGPLVQEHILFRNDTVVLTSATMRTAGTFDYVRDRLQCYDADCTFVGSPFDYRESTLLYLPTDLPEPNASGYQSAVEQALINLAKAVGGRTLALFTSYAQLRRTVQSVAPALTEAGITVLSQSSGVSRHQLLELFKTNQRTILLGTRSFWEGVDVIGPALSALVLVRLPFAVPSDPIVEARSQTFDDPFYQYQVPDAILRFRQGFGRLIRSKTDRGLVVVLDKRIQSKNYGQLFLDSLPECTVHRGPLINLPSAAADWIERLAPPGDWQG